MGRKEYLSFLSCSLLCYFVIIIVVGMFVGAAIKELAVVPTLVSLVRHYTMVAVAQQSGAFAYTPK